MLIALVGMPGGGKSEAGFFLRDIKGFGYLRFGDIVEDGAKALGGVNEVNEKKFREQIRKEFGMKAMAVKVHPLINKLLGQYKDVVLDGLYSWEEYEYLKKRYPELLLVCIYAAPNIRYQRLKNRPHRSLSLVEARSRDIAEIIALNKGGPIALADFLIVNKDSLDKFHNNLEEILELIERGEYYSVRR